MFSYHGYKQTSKDHRSPWAAASKAVRPFTPPLWAAMPCRALSGWAAMASLVMRIRAVALARLSRQPGRPQVQRGYAYHILHEIRRADTVHHITPLREDWTRRLDITNLIPLASSTHNAIHTLYDQDAATKATTQALLRQILAEHPQRVGVSKLF